MNNNLKINVHDGVKSQEFLGIIKRGETVEKYMRGDKPPDTEYAFKFIKYADVDFQTAIVLFSIQDRDYDFMNQAAFLSAQAVEKYLKAFLYWSSLQHRPILSSEQLLKESINLRHDLVKIIKKCVVEDADFNKFRSQIKNINKYSLLRYPDIEDQMVYSDYGLSISSRILDDVKAIGSFVKELIKNKK